MSTPLACSVTRDPERTVYVWMLVPFVALLLAAWWGERAAFAPRSPRRIPDALLLGLVVAGCAGLAYGLWRWLGPISASWVARGGAWKAGGASLLLVSLLPLVGAGLAGMYLLVLPLMGLSERRLQRCLAAMRAATTDAVGTDTCVRRIWLIDYSNVTACPPPDCDVLEVEADDEPKADLERLRAKVEMLRKRRERPLILEVVVPWDDEGIAFRRLVGHRLFDRDDPGAVHDRLRPPVRREPK